MEVFEVILRSMISNLRGRLHKSVNTVIISYVSSQYFILSSPFRIIVSINCTKFD